MLYGRLGFISLIVASSSVKELVGKICAFVEKEYFNSCIKIWRRRLVLVFYLCFSNKHPYCVPLAWDQTILKCLLTEKGLKFEKTRILCLVWAAFEIDCCFSTGAFYSTKLIFSENPWTSHVGIKYFSHQAAYRLYYWNKNVYFF